MKGCSRARYCRVAVLGFGLLQPRPAHAFLFEEHANIGRDAVGGLSPADRKSLERMWDAAILADPVAAGRLLRRTGKAETDGVDYQRAPTHDRVTEPDGSFLDFGALPAVAADHSCSPVDMWATATRKPWFRAVYADVGRTEQQIHHDDPSYGRRLDAWHQGNLDLLADDPGYLAGAGGNNAHFVLARGSDVDVADYLANSAIVGAPINATAAYSFYHVSALAAAAKLSTFAPGTPAYGAWAIRVLSIEAFALHFLEDSFAAGHFVGFTVVASASERTGTHDYYCEKGLGATTWGSARSASAFTESTIASLLGEAGPKATPLAIEQCVDRWGVGVNYAAHGDAFQSGPSPFGQSSIHEGCPLAEDLSDRAMAARAVRVSLHQVIEVAAGSAPLPALIDADADALATDVVCGEGRTVTAVEARVVKRAIPYLSVVLGMTPTPYRADVPLPRFRSDYGLMIRGSAATRLGVAIGGGADARFQGVVQVGLGIGGNVDGLTTQATDGLFYAEATAAGYSADDASTCSDCSQAPARIGGGVRLHLPFMLVPGDAVIPAVALLFSRSTAERLALEAARGSLWWHFERIHAGRQVSWQILLGRQVAVYWSGANDNFKMTDLELPWLEVRTPHLFSERLGTDAALQIGSSIEWDRLTTPDSTLRRTAGAAYLRVAFDTAYNLYP